MDTCRVLKWRWVIGTQVAQPFSENGDLAISNTRKQRMSSKTCVISVPLLLRLVQKLAIMNILFLSHINYTIEDGDGCQPPEKLVKMQPHPFRPCFKDFSCKSHARACWSHVSHQHNTETAWAINTQSKNKESSKLSPHRGNEGRYCALSPCVQMVCYRLINLEP